MPALNAKRAHKYLTTGCVRCPHCQSEDIEGGDWDVDTHGASQAVRCEACDQSWRDHYALIGMSDDCERYFDKAASGPADLRAIAGSDIFTDAPESQAAVERAIATLNRYADGRISHKNF